MGPSAVCPKRAHPIAVADAIWARRTAGRGARSRLGWDRGRAL